MTPWLAIARSLPWPAGRALRLDLKVLFITGFAANAVIGNGAVDHGMQVLTKPFAMNTLASRIERLITGA